MRRKHTILQTEPFQPRRLKEIFRPLSEPLPGSPRRNKPVQFTLRGAPDDAGVRAVGGRAGAALGPQAIREALGLLMTGPDGAFENILLDGGSDIPITPNNITQSHNALRLQLTQDFQSGATPIVFGGGHDFGFPHIAALSDTFGSKKVGLVNVDAHLDLRPVHNGLITSGSPYFLALESQCLLGKNFTEFGIQSHCNDSRLFDYAKARGVRVISLSQSRRAGGPIASLKSVIGRLAARGLKICVSIDLDAMQMAVAPGVSAPQCDGFSAEEFLGFCRCAGASPAVMSLGLFEVSPPLDSHNATSKLAALGAYAFIEARIAAK